MDNFEIVDGLKLLTTKDVGLLKLMSGANRASKKDIYDLDFITDSIPLPELFYQLKEKRTKYSNDKYKTIFDLDDEKSPVEFPELLVLFDEIKKISGGRPSHSHDRIVIVEGNKMWKEARYSWLRKVRNLFQDINIPYPQPKGIDI